LRNGGNRRGTTQGDGEQTGGTVHGDSFRRNLTLYESREELSTGVGWSIAIHQVIATNWNFTADERTNMFQKKWN
jgi:hypothetical protein